MSKKKLVPVHPGEVLLALDISVDSRRINEIVRGKRSMTANTALRLARYFETSPEFWLGLQSQYDLDCEEDELGPRLDREVQVYSKVH